MIAFLLEAAMRSLALAAAVGLGVVALRIRNPQVEKLLWTTVLAGAAAIPALMKLSLAPVLPAASFALPDVVIQTVRHRVPADWLAALSLLHVAVTIVLLLRVAIGFGRMTWLRSHSARVLEAWTRGADVRVSRKLSSAITFGSTILLPWDQSTWSETKRAAVLAHERAHVRNHDCQVQWLAAAYGCVFWFSPLAWWLRRRLATLAERSSDDAVLRESPDRGEYAAVLLEAAQARSTVRMAISMAGGDVARRIERILSGHLPSRVPAPWHSAVAILLVVPAVVLAADTPTAARVADSQDTQFGMSTAEPHIVSSGSQMERWYPQEAKRAGTEGLVQIAVTLDEAGRPYDTVVLSEYPPGVGFGAAASGLAHDMTYANPTGHPATLTFRVKFELQGHGGSGTYGTTNFESDSR